MCSCKNSDFPEKKKKNNFKPFWAVSIITKSLLCILKEAIVQNSEGLSVSVSLSLPVSLHWVLSGLYQVEASNSVSQILLGSMLYFCLVYRLDFEISIRPSSLAGKGTLVHTDENTSCPAADRFMKWSSVWQSNVRHITRVKGRVLSQWKVSGHLLVF